MTTIPLCPSPANNPVDLALLYVKYRPFVRSVLLRSGVPSRDVEDGIHDVFVIVQRRIDDLDPTRSPCPYLYVVAYQVASNYRRSGWNRREHLVEELPDEPLLEGIKTAEDELRIEEDRRAVVCRVMKLSPKLRAVVVAHELEGRPMPEVAAALGITLKTAYARLGLARAALARSAASLRTG